MLNLDSGESGSDEEEDNVNKGTKSWWESEQERRVVAGLRAPPDRKYVACFALAPRRPSVVLGRDAESRASNSREYIFDGQELHLDRPDYQLCDITDPLIVKFIKDPVNLAETYDVSGSSFLLDSGVGLGHSSPPLLLPGCPADAARCLTRYTEPESELCGTALLCPNPPQRQNGWYKPAALNLIKTLMRIKYMHVRETGEKAPDSLCYSAIEEYERDAHAEESD